MAQGSHHDQLHSTDTSLSNVSGSRSTARTPTLQHKMDKIHEKQMELRQLEHIANHTEQLGLQLENLAKHFKNLSDDAKKVDKAFTNWDTVFRVMGMLTDDTLNKDHPTIVKLPIRRNPDHPDDTMQQ